MTRDDIMRMAREAGFRTGRIELSIGDSLPFIAPISGASCIVEMERFAALVAAAKIEECAQLVDPKPPLYETDQAHMALSAAADRIRELGAP